MLINLTNHPSTQWEPEQLHVAREKYGRIKDLPFPVVNPSWDEEMILNLAGRTVDKVLDILSKSHRPGEKNAVHIQGEFTLVYAVVSRCLARGIPCVASTTKRNVLMPDHGEKFSRFSFVRFRHYRP